MIKYKFNEINVNNSKKPYKRLDIEFKDKSKDLIAIYLITDVAIIDYKKVIIPYNRALSGRSNKEIISGDICRLEITKETTKIIDIYKEDEDKNYVEINTLELCNLIQIWCNKVNENRSTNIFLAISDNVLHDKKYDANFIEFYEKRINFLYKVAFKFILDNHNSQTSPIYNEVIKLEKNLLEQTKKDFNAFKGFNTSQGLECFSNIAYQTAFEKRIESNIYLLTPIMSFLYKRFLDTITDDYKKNNAKLISETILDFNYASNLISGNMSFRIGRLKFR